MRGSLLLTQLLAPLVWATLLAWLALVCVSDGRHRRIPNRLVLAGLVLGLAAQAALPRGAGLLDLSHPGSVGFWDALVAVLLSGAAGWLLYRLGLFGGGDAKLLAAVAAFTGTTGVLPVILATLLAGGLLALTVLLCRRGSSVPLAKAAKLPYSWAIATGSVVFAAASSSRWLSG